MRYRNRIGLVGSALMVAFIAGCSADQNLVSAPEATLRNSRAAETWVSNVFLCKFGPAGTTATFSLNATGGNLLLGNQVTLNAISDHVNCTAVWEATDESVVTVTATEIGSTEGLVLQELYIVGGLDDIQVFDPAGATASIRVDAHTSGYIKFVNVPGELPPPPPPPATQGCTPGYWKQSQHFDSWPVAYTPGMSFGSVFADAFPGMTLLDVVGQGGGGINALGRHTVAALLNAGNADVQNGLTTAQVIAAFNAAVASGDYETQKNIFAGLNELGCPLN